MIRSRTLVHRKGQRKFPTSLSSHPTATVSPVTSSTLPNPDPMDRILFGRGCYHWASYYCVMLPLWEAFGDGKGGLLVQNQSSIPVSPGIKCNKLCKVV